MEIGHQQADSSFPIIARHGRFESNPGGKAHRSGNSIAARNNIRVRELQCGETNFARRELALEPVPITVLALAHPSCRVCYIRDVQGSLQHVELVLCRLPVTQTILSSMDKILSGSAVATSAAKTLFGIAMAPRRAVI